MGIVASLFFALVVFQDASGSDALSEINDLGTLMLLGFVVSVVGAIALTVVRFRIRDKKPEEPQFISINAREEK